MRNKHTASGCYRFDSREHERTTKIMKIIVIARAHQGPKKPVLFSFPKLVRREHDCNFNQNRLIEEHNDIQIQPQETDNSDRATVFRLASEHNKVQGSWPRVIQSNGTGHS